VRPFRQALNIFYQRYEHNLGGVSLVKQWHRCLEMVKEENWIWLLPDDDVPSSTCVERFLEVQKHKPQCHLFRFSTVHIDETDRLIKTNTKPPELESGVDFIMNKYKYIRNSSLAEYVFSKAAFEETKGFVDLPLAWGSDDLMWLELAGDHGIVTITDATVGLRQSGANISSQTKKYAEIHTRAKYQMLEYLLSNQSFMHKIELSYGLSYFRQVLTEHLFYHYKSYNLKFDFKKIVTFAQLNSKILGGGFLKNTYRLLRFVLKNKT
jgi:hypothetical protein